MFDVIFVTCMAALFLFWFLYTCAYDVVCIYYCVCVIFWGWSVYSLSRMGVY